MSEILLRRLRPQDLTELGMLADAMEARPASCDASLEDRGELEAFLGWQAAETSGGIWMGLRDETPVGFCRAFPVRPGQEALVHLVGLPGVGVGTDGMLQEAGLRAVLSCFFDGYGCRRVTLPVMDLPGYPLLELARRAFEPLGIRHEGCMRQAAFTRLQADPLDLHLFGILLEEWHGRN